jgi:chromosome segregation ATPase
MSDENGGASFEDDEFGADADALPEAVDPALGGRLDTVHRSLSTLGMRIDALVTSTTTYRSALTDRLTEYADLVTKLTRTQAADLEEYRRANERTISELRRGLASSEEVLERIGARIDSMLTDTESSDDQSRRMLAEVRGILDAQENLGRFLTESLDQFGDRVVERIAATQTASVEQIEALRGALRDTDHQDEALREALLPLREQIDHIDGQLGDRSRDDAIVDRIAALDERLTALARVDPAAAVAGHLDTLHSAVGLLATADQVASLSADVRNQISEVLGSSTDDAVLDHLSRIERELTSSNQVAAESWGEFAGLRAKVDAILETSANETGAVSHLLDEIRETLLDVASGEVLGALWDEFRAARTSIDEVLVAVERTADTDSGDDGAAEMVARFEALRADVSALTDAVRDLLEQAEVVDESEPAPTDAMLVAVAADVSTLRRELSQGLVVEPSDALSGAVEQLRADVAALDDRLRAIDDLQAAVESLRPAETDAALDDDEQDGDGWSAGSAVAATLDELRSVREELGALTERMDRITDLEAAVGALRDDVQVANAPVEVEPADGPAPLTSEHLDDLGGELATLRSTVEHVGGDLRTVRTGVEDIIARLDEGFTLAEDEPTVAAPVLPPQLDDQLAALRDQITTEFDALRMLVGTGPAGDDADTEAAEPAVVEVDLTPITELLEHVRDDLAELPGLIERSAPAPAPSQAPAEHADAYASIDPDVIDLLREEIRTAGAVPDDLLDQLRKELVALRRRIALRAEGEIFSDAQLELIADAVARKLAE